MVFLQDFKLEIRFSKTEKHELKIENDKLNHERKNQFSEKNRIKINSIQFNDKMADNINRPKNEQKKLQIAFLNQDDFFHFHNNIAYTALQTIEEIEKKLKDESKLTEYDANQFNVTKVFLKELSNTLPLRFESLLDKTYVIP